MEPKTIRAALHGVQVAANHAFDLECVQVGCVDVRRAQVGLVEMKKARSQETWGVFVYVFDLG